MMKHETTPLYFEDFPVGETFVSPVSTTLTEESIIQFAQQYDPQFFHLDAEAAKNSFFQGLAGSGWQTVMIAMRQFVDMLSARVEGGLIGLSIDKLRWFKPTRPGDVLTGSVEVLGKRLSESKPGFGVVQVRWVVHDQNQTVVMSLENAIWVHCRPAA